MNINRRTLLAICLILISTITSSCSVIIDISTYVGTPDKAVKKVLDLTLEDFAEQDFNSIFIIESIRSVYNHSKFKEISHTADTLSFTFTEGEFVTEVEVSVERNSSGFVTGMQFNDQLITGEPGINYFSNSLEKGDLNTLPSVIQLDLGYNTLAMPNFYSARPLGAIIGLINEGLETKGMYHVPRYLVEMLIMERILSSDSLIDFVITDNIIYALMRQTDSDAGEYLLWYDGKYLTMAGNLSFTRGV